MAAHSAIVYMLSNNYFLYYNMELLLYYIPVVDFLTVIGVHEMHEYMVECTPISYCLKITILLVHDLLRVIIDLYPYMMTHPYQEIGI